MIVDFDYEGLQGCEFPEPENSRVGLGALIVVANFNLGGRSIYRRNKIRWGVFSRNGPQNGPNPCLGGFFHEKRFGLLDNLG